MPIVVVTFVVVSMLLFAPRALALTCSGTLTSHQIGRSTVSGGAQPLAIEGAFASIRDGGNYTLCTTDTNGAVNFSTTWVMTQAANGYAQAGTMYRYGYGSCVKRWAEETPPGGHFVDYYIGGCSTVGEGHRYYEQTVLTSSGYRIQEDIDVTAIHQSSFSPFSWTGNMNATFNSEVYYLNSNISGSASLNTLYQGMEVQSLSNDQFVSTCGNANFGTAPSTGRFVFIATSCNSQASYTN